MGFVYKELIHPQLFKIQVPLLFFGGQKLLDSRIKPFLGLFNLFNDLASLFIFSGSEHLHNGRF